MWEYRGREDFYLTSVERVASIFQAKRANAGKSSVTSVHIVASICDVHNEAFRYETKWVAQAVRTI